MTSELSESFAEGSTILSELTEIAVDSSSALSVFPELTIEESVEHSERSESFADGSTVLSESSDGFFIILKHRPNVGNLLPRHQTSFPNVGNVVPRGQRSSPNLGTHFSTPKVLNNLNLLTQPVQKGVSQKKEGTQITQKPQIDAKHRLLI